MSCNKSNCNCICNKKCNIPNKAYYKQPKDCIPKKLWQQVNQKGFNSLESFGDFNSLLEFNNDLFAYNSNGLYKMLDKNIGFWKKMYIPSTAYPFYFVALGDYLYLYDNDKNLFSIQANYDFTASNWTQISSTDSSSNTIYVKPMLIAQFNNINYLYGVNYSVAAGSHFNIVRSNHLTSSNKVWTVVSNDDFGDSENLYVAFMLEYNEKIYVGTNTITKSEFPDKSFYITPKGVQIWSSETADTPISWEQINNSGFNSTYSEPPITYNINQIIGSAIVYTDPKTKLTNLFVGTNSILGSELWKYDDISNSWTKIEMNNFSTNINIIEIPSMAIFSSNLVILETGTDVCRIMSYNSISYVKLIDCPSNNNYILSNSNSNCTLEYYDDNNSNSNSSYEGAIAFTLINYNNGLYLLTRDVNNYDYVWLLFIDKYCLGKPHNSDSNKIGYNADSTGCGTLALGVCSHAEGCNTLAEGKASHAEGLSTIASGIASHSEGSNTIAQGDYSHAEGFSTTATGEASHAEGSNNTAGGDQAHAEGYYNNASGINSHAEGYDNIASADQAHVEGNFNTASGNQSHAEGSGNTASGPRSHAEGFGNTASGDQAHTEGRNTIASGPQSHAEGYLNTVSGNQAHAEGRNTIASGPQSHAEGYLNTANGTQAHAEGQENTASGDQAHAEGYLNTASGKQAHAEGYLNRASGNYSHAEGQENSARGEYSHAEGLVSIAIGEASHVEGTTSIARGIASHAEGKQNTTNGNNSHAECYLNFANGNNSHAEGQENNASGDQSHAEGFGNTASGPSSHAEGSSNTVSGPSSHAEGFGNTAIGDQSHTEGFGNTAIGAQAHAEGYNCIALGERSHAQGDSTEANGYASFTTGTGTIAAQSNQTVIGQFNNIPTANDVFIIGNGPNTSARSNAFRFQFNGLAYAAGTAPAWNSGGADYAEMFEWLDKNPDNEDRVGYFVTLDGENIRKATSNDSYILGVISATAGFIGNSNGVDWKERYLKDEWGRAIYEWIDVTENQTVIENDVYVTKEVTKQIYAPKINPNYDPAKEYIPRLERPEWSPVGLIGKLLVRDDGTSEVNGYCRSNNDGIATKSEIGFRVLKRISENQILILFK